MSHSNASTLLRAPDTRATIWLILRMVPQLDQVRDMTRSVDSTVSLNAVRAQAALLDALASLWKTLPITSRLHGRSAWEWVQVCQNDPDTAIDALLVARASCVPGKRLPSA